MGSEEKGAVQSGQSAMSKIAILAGGLLILEGFGFFYGTGTQSWTALIPAFVGLPILLLGLLALKESARKHAMHLATVLGLLGFLASAGRLISSGSFDVSSPAPLSQGIMALVCGLFFLLCLKSFVDARRRRSQENQ